MVEESQNQKSMAKRVSGMVTSISGLKSIKVEMQQLMRHPRYGKFIPRRTVMHVHDPRNQAKVGDKVEVMECSPKSKTKRWKLVRILESGIEKVT
jgi:small subunit ribosomal protein S17